MNRSYSKIRHIQEANQRLEKRVMSEQMSWYQGYDKDRQAAENWYKQNANTVNEIIGLGALFIPVIGPFISAGVGLADAAVYAKQGKNAEAGVVFLLSLLPGASSLVSKIPGVKQLGAEGMKALASKILTKAPLTSIEQGVLTGVKSNISLIKQEAGNTVKKMATNAVSKVSNSVTKPGVKKSLEHIAKHGVDKAGEEAVLNAI